LTTPLAARPLLPAYAALAATLVLWAVSFPATRVAMAAFHPGELALLRFALSSVALLVYTRHLELPLPDLADMPRLALTGLLTVTIYQLGFNYGLQTVSSGPAAVLIDTIPIWTALLGALFLKERIRAWGWAGLVLGFAGAALIALGENHGSNGRIDLEQGALLLIIAALAFAAATVVQKPLLPKYGAVGVTTWSFLFGTLGLLWAVPGLLPQLQVAPRSAVLCVVFLAAVAWAWLGEAPGLLSWFGGAVALAGVALVQLKGKA